MIFNPVSVGSGSSFDPFPNLNYLGHVEYFTGDRTTSSSITLTSPETWTAPLLVLLVQAFSIYKTLPAVTKIAVNEYGASDGMAITGLSYQTYSQAAADVGILGDLYIQGTGNGVRFIYTAGSGDNGDGLSGLIIHAWELAATS